MKRDNEMPTNIRLSKEEQKELSEKYLEVNKVLINMGKRPIQESELVHLVLEKSINNIKVSKDGEIYLDV